MVYCSVASLCGSCVSGCRVVLWLTSPLSCSFNTPLKIHHHHHLSPWPRLRSLFVLYSAQSSNSWFIFLFFCSLSADLQQQSERKWSPTGALGRRERGNGGHSDSKTLGLKNWIWQVLGFTPHYLQGSNSLCWVFMCFCDAWYGFKAPVRFCSEKTNLCQVATLCRCNYFNAKLSLQLQKWQNYKKCNKTKIKVKTKNIKKAN